MVLIDKGSDEMYRMLESVIEMQGINKQKMADDIEMQHATLLTKLSGESKFTLDEAVKIKEYLNVKVPIEELFGDE